MIDGVSNASSVVPDMTSWPMFHYRAELVRIIDGDTVEVDCDLGMHITRRVHLRIKDIDTPEIYGRNATPAGERAADALQSLIAGQELFVATYKGRKSFDRYIADIYLIDDEGGWIDVGAWMVDRGWALRVS